MEQTWVIYQTFYQATTWQNSLKWTDGRTEGRKEGNYQNQQAAKETDRRSGLLLKLELFVLLKGHQQVSEQGRWRDGSEVKSMCCSFRGPKFKS